MKRVFSLLFVALISTSAFAQTTWNVDNAHAKLAFSTVHLGISDVSGHFSEFDATIVASEEDFSDAVFELTVDVASIDTEVGMRDDHLRSADFFEVEKFPSASFVITKVAGNQVTGNLTVKGITKTISFPAEISVNGGKVSAKANITIDRTDFGIKYNSKKFFDAIGDKAIYDDFNLTVSLISE